MNSFKSSKSADHIREWNNERHVMDEALRKARAKAEKDISRQKVQANLIVGTALIVIFCMFYWG